MSNVNLVDKQLKVGKETAEVGDFLAELIKDIKAKKDIATIASENLQNLYQAVEGYEKLDDEAKHESRSETLGYILGQIGEALDS